LDYADLFLTNVMAFNSTDVMPMTIRARMLMGPCAAPSPRKPFRSYVSSMLSKLGLAASLFGEPRRQTS
jgi:hypothetical protein